MVCSISWRLQVSLLQRLCYTDVTRWRHTLRSYRDLELKRGTTWHHTRPGQWVCPHTHTHTLVQDNLQTGSNWPEILYYVNTSLILWLLFNAYGLGTGFPTTGSQTNTRPWFKLYSLSVVFFSNHFLILNEKMVHGRFPFFSTFIKSLVWIPDAVITVPHCLMLSMLPFKTNNS